ncbi:DUF1653 domain-containing protein [Zhongshania guokunii]|uniref:DUF1653 domain-containing protein n=1 Tax=Zhongshania guokunii TaxID=641783 RepID=A0ABV3U2L4_9GAMM
MQSRNLPAGLYRHYKGGEYRVYEVATHSETEELLVVYRPLYGAGALWVRPLAMFVELIEFKGETMPRFSLVEADSDASS